MNNKLIKKLDILLSKHKTISGQLEDESVYQDHELLKKLNKEFAKIDPIVNKYNEYKDLINNIEESKSFLTDKEFRMMAEEDIKTNTAKKITLEEYFENELVDKDPNDTKDILKMN